MVAVLAALIFSGAFILSVAVIAASIAPQWERILRLASGQTEPAFAPLSQLALAERRIRLNRWASAPASQPVRLREAA